MKVVFIGNGAFVGWATGVSPGAGESAGAATLSQRLGPRSSAGMAGGSLIQRRIQSASRREPTSVRSAATLPPAAPTWWQLRQPWASIVDLTCASLAGSAWPLLKPLEL